MGGCQQELMRVNRIPVVGVFVCTQLWPAVHVFLFLSAGMTLLLTLLLSYNVVDASLRLIKNNFNKRKYYVCMKIGRKIMVLILNECLLYK